MDTGILFATCRHAISTRIWHTRPPTHPPVRRTTSRAEGRVMSLMEASSSTLPSAPTCSGHALNCGRVGLCACVEESMHEERARGHRVRESMRECAHGSDRDRECAQNVYTLHVPTLTPTHTPCNQSHAVCMLATATHVKVHTHI